MPNQHEDLSNNLEVSNAADVIFDPVPQKPCTEAKDAGTWGQYMHMGIKTD